MEDFMSTQVIHDVTLVLLRGNIVEVQADAIVNAANSALAGGGGVDGAIHRAGGSSIMAECNKYDGCPTGSAVATTAGRLHAQYVFHAVGPIYHGSDEDARLLASAYHTCLQLAEERQLKSIAFPSISTGVYGYPIDEAAPIAVQTVIEHIQQPTSLQQIMFVLFDNNSYTVYKNTLAQLVP